MRKTMITMATVALASSVFAGIAVAGGDEKEVSASVDNRQCSPTYAPLISGLTLARVIGNVSAPSTQNAGSCN